MSADNQEILSELYREVHRTLTEKLRPFRLAPVMNDVGKNSRPGFTDLGIVSGFKDPEFIGRFGTALEKVEDSDIAALTLYLPAQDSLVMALGKLAEHIEAAPDGKTGLPYFDEWTPAHDSPSKEVPLVWSQKFQDEPRKLMSQGYRIGKSQPSTSGTPGVFVTIFVRMDNR